MVAGAINEPLNCLADSLPNDSPAKSKSDRQKQIDEKAYEALSLLEDLETIQINKRASVDYQPQVLRIRNLIRELRRMKVKEAQVIETDLEKN